MSRELALFAIVLSLVALAYGNPPRFITAGGDSAKNYAFFASFKFFPDIAPPNRENDLVAVVFAKAYPGLPSFPPAVSVAYAKGRRQLDDSSATFEGSLAGMLWAYSALTEYCETNDVDGYQVGQDREIQTARWQDGDWGNVERGRTTDDVYWASLNESAGIFTLNCRISTSNRLDGGLEIDPYSLKCDVIVNAANFWKSDETDCEDNKRFVALLVYVATADAEIRLGNNLNRVDPSDNQGVLTFNDDKSFLKWKPTFDDGDSGTEYQVHASSKDFTETLNLPPGLVSLAEVVYSFLSPKSQTNLIVWDPEMGVKDQTTSGAAIVSVSFFLVATLVTLLF